MTTYQGPDGAKVDLDPATVKMLEALALASKQSFSQLATRAVELLRVQMIEPKQRGGRRAAQ